MQKTTLVVAFFLAAVLAGLFVHFNMRSSPVPSVKENFMQKQLGMPIDGGIGPYDGVSQDGGVSGFMKNEPSSAPVGASPLPSQSDESNKLMFLVGNKIDSSCCPSAFNTDTGCVCLTEDNKQLMGSRGGNRA